MRGDYENNFLDSVLNRRRGLPITLRAIFATMAATSRRL